MGQSICSVADCVEPIGRRGAKGMCPKHYRESRPPCTIDGCEKVQVSRGLCAMHNYRARTVGDPHATASGRKNRPPSLCEVEGCEQPRRKFEWCAGHYAQWYRSGEVKPFAYRWGSGGYNSTHRRIVRVKGSAANHTCADCGQQAQEWSYIGGGADEEVDDRGLAFSRDASRYEPRCIPCHRRFDGWHDKISTA